MSIYDRQNVPAKEKSLLGRTLYIPRMSIEGAMSMAAAFRSIGINGQISPESDSESLEQARKYTIGEECFPEIVTLGSFLRLIEEDNFDSKKTAFLMPTAGGPCRFGQYKQLLEKILKERGLEEALVVSPTSADGYAGFSENAKHFVRLGWWSVVCADAIRKLLLQTRPYEKKQGETDRVHTECLNRLCKLIEKPDMEMKVKFRSLVELMSEISDSFAQIPANYSREKPLIGIVGEIYCRLDEFTNAHLIRRIERLGGEVWIASISEWVLYTNFMQKHDHLIDGMRFTKSMLGAIVRDKIQRSDEHKLLKALHKRILGYEEPESIKNLVKLSEPYLPHWGALGEMVLNVGGTIYYYGKGADGVIDISPFTCMNGIVCEAVYPRVSREHENIPIRNFYFDGTESDYDRDVEIFLELARTYGKRKKSHRAYPPHFPS